MSRQPVGSRQGPVSPKVAGAATVVVLLWASAFVAVDIALESTTPGQLALARYVVASIVFLAVAIWRRMARPPVRDLLRFALAGGIGIALYNLALNTGQETVRPGVASLLINTVPIWTLLLARLVLGERMTPRGLLGSGVAFAGVAIIGLAEGDWGGFEAGVASILAAAVAQALYFVIVKPMLERYHPVELTAWAVWFGCLFLLPFRRGLLAALQHCSSAALGSILFLGVGPAAIAYMAWSYVLGELPAGQASSVLFLIPVVAIALGWLVLGDVPEPVALAGGSLAVIGVLLGRETA